ncbi:MAG: beta-phosphoglucomutase family hydrolase [Candidatus Krumholzibacteriia bacterium]
MLHREPRTPPEYIYPVDPWRIVEKRFAPRYLEQTETLFALANGYLGIRGAFEEGRPVFQSGTFINGFHETWPITYGETAFGFATTGQTMLNVPDGKRLRLFVDDEPFVLDYAHLLNFERVLDMQEGELERRVLWETPAGKRVEVRSTRLVSFEHRHVAAIDYEVILHDAEAPVVVVSELAVPTDARGQDGDPRRARTFDERVLVPALQRCEGHRLLLAHRTRNSGMAIACGVHHEVWSSSTYSVEARCEEDHGSLVYSTRLEAGGSLRITKYQAYHTSHTAPPSELADRADRTLDRTAGDGWDDLRASQRKFVADFWRRSDVEIRGDLKVQQAVRWNLFQLLQASARAEGAGIGARGLTGQTYEGHYFWDTEIYVLPFLVYTAPRIARNLLRFRHGMLGQARRRAQEVGEQGALFPWRTINGDEASAYYAAGTAQYHINADIAYALTKYVQMTGDDAFMAEFGAEILVETARLWCSLGFFTDRDGHRFCINGVTGPDEYNTVVNNNLFTNVMARQNLHAAARVLHELAEREPERYAALVDRTGFRPEEAVEWTRAADLMYLPYDEVRGIHLQDDSFLEKQRWDLDDMPPDKFPLLLNFHPLVIYRHRVIKQADVVMALFLLGDRFTPEEKRRDFDYYDPLTTGDSSLSVCIQSIIASEIGYSEEAYEYFRYAVLTDLADLGGNVRDGAHIAAIGGTWLALTFGFAGLRDHDGVPAFDPRLPVQWEAMSFPLTVRGRELRVEIEHERATYELRTGEPLEIRHLGQEVTLQPGEPLELPVRRPEPRPRLHLDEVIPPDRFDAVLFDMDGVVTATAEVHAEAWKRMFDAYLEERSERRGEPFRPFEVGTDYLLHVDGKPRLAGVHDFLVSRGIILPAGEPDDPPQKETEWGLGNRKNELVHEVIRTEGVRAYPGTIDVLHRLRERGVRTALVTSSTNAELTLEAAGVIDLFDARVDGTTALAERLPGKPAPDTYLAAARRLGVEPDRAVVVEDAISGVEAGRRGDFGLVIGVARAATPDELRRNGADVVVEDLGDLTWED